MKKLYSAASFFDLDHTLCKANTSFRFGLFLYHQKKLPLYVIPYLVSIYILCKAGLFPLSLLHKQACRLLFYQKPLIDLEKDVDQFLDLELNTLLHPITFDIFKKAKSDHHYTLLLSNSPDFLVESIAKRLHFNAWRGTEYQKDLSGKIIAISHSLEGQDKALIVEKTRKQLSLESDQTFGYTDSHLDLLFLEAVGHPTAINPDKKLKRIANKKGWQILEKC